MDCTVLDLSLIPQRAVIEPQRIRVMREWRLMIGWRNSAAPWPLGMLMRGPIIFLV